MDNKIKNISLKFNCPSDWNSMKSVEDGKFCDHCQKTVYDFTDAKQAEFLTILAENSGNICGRFRQEQMTPAPIKFPAWKKWVSAALVLVGINVFNNKAGAQTTKASQSKTVAAPKPETIVLGMAIQKDASFPGGFDGLTRFVQKNLHYTTGMKDGRVIALFIVNKDGTLSNFRITKGLSELNDVEVLRVLKLLPKWSPAIEGNKPVAVEYSLPINFDSSTKKD